jgi:putative glutamine amidotransferase
MARPLIGILGNYYLVNDDYPVQASGEMNIDAISEVCDGISVIVPSLPNNATSEELADICDGFVFTGGRPNVHPKFYGHEATSAHGIFDLNRDEVTLPLIKHCIKIGKPILGICRGFQEFNVAFGGTLHPEIRDLDGRINHRMPPEGTLDEKFAPRHTIDFKAAGPFSKIIGKTQVMVNSLHGQGIDEPGQGIILDGFAPDGTPEALYIQDSKSFCLAVQWHPEWNAKLDEVSSPIFEAFGKALRDKNFLQ